MQPGELALRSRAIAQLANVVQAMRTLASARRRQAQDTSSALARYAAATRAALRQVFALLGAGHETVASAPGERRVIALFSEHGFVGSLNDRVLDEALALARARGARLIAVGGRGQRLCRERGVDAGDAGPMPTTLPAVRVTAGRLVESLFVAVAAGDVGEIQIVFAEDRQPLGWAPRALRIFPPDLEADAGPPPEGQPIHTLEPRLLAVRALEEDAFAQVNRAVGAAFASEQAARFVAMDAARHHIEQKLEELRGLERTLRQETVTNEILEIASGADLAREAS